LHSLVEMIAVWGRDGDGDGGKAMEGKVQYCFNLT